MGGALSCAIKIGPDAAREAAKADLYFSSDCVPGIRRLGDRERGFDYRHDLGRPMTREDLSRIERLRIPPAWRDVWICEDERGHLQATGRDVKGRKQYRYHERWRMVRDAAKYDRLAEFGEALARIRESVDADLRRPSPDRRRVLALAVAILDRTFVRVGNPQYAKRNESYGLTTLRAAHAELDSTRLALRFRGKAGKELAVGVDDPRIARALRRVQELPGQELFQYLDDAGEVRVVESGDVNAYLREAGGDDISSKDFRTWGGSLAAALVLAKAGDGPPSERVVTEAVRQASKLLHNTPAVCRRSYVHPGLIELYRSGGFGDAWKAAQRHRARSPWLDQHESAFLALLHTLAGS